MVVKSTSSLLVEVIMNPSTLPWTDLIDEREMTSVLEDGRHSTLVLHFGMLVLRRGLSIYPSKSA